MERTEGKVMGYTVKPMRKPTAYGQKYHITLWVKEKGKRDDVPYGFSSFGPDPKLKMNGRSVHVARGDKVDLCFTVNGRYNNINWKQSGVVFDG